jgi:hypothetical protein
VAYWKTEESLTQADRDKSVVHIQNRHLLLLVEIINTIYINDLENPYVETKAVSIGYEVIL